MRLRPIPILAVVAVLPLIAACMASTRDVDTLREQVQVLQKTNTDLQRRVEEHTMRLEGIDNSLQMLETRVEDNTRRTEDIKASLAGEAVTMAAPVAAPAAEPKQVQPAPAAPPAPAPAGPAKVAAKEQPKAKTPQPYASRTFAKGEDLYNSAYGHFEKGEYGQAILEFEEFVVNYQKAELADNAQYWIGECYYAQKDYRQAIREFDKVEKLFPKGNKVPAAKLKKGMAYRELGNLDEAVRELREVAAKYPDSEEALLANEKVKLWKEGGQR